VTDRQRLWQFREAALRHPVLVTLWTIQERGVRLALDQRGLVRCFPTGSVSDEEKAALRAAPRELVVALVVLGTADVIEQFRVM
jgi:hypothetical protein